LPHALDHDQRANASMLGRAGGAFMIEQAQFTPDRVASEIARLAAAPDKLAEMAAAARGQGVLDGAERLADLVMGVVSRSREKQASTEPATTP
jgi:UDP-N-acetylglucosamine--N-acetylmuramyl-(pentapeptide) pyrophosphoryl-undecaprenol N-acetylglucosamine transferase